jgi:transaldolase
MKIFLDTADIDEISKAHQTHLIQGVTTNPTLIKRSGGDPVEVIKEISKSFPFESISAEVVADTADEMVAQAQQYKDLWNVTIKVPCTVEGLKACYQLTSAQNFRVNVTLVFSVSQAILAERAGARYISPFVGRWCDNSVDGIGLIESIEKVFNNSYTTAEVIAASIRDLAQLEGVALAGAQIATVPPKVFWSMYNNILTDKGLELFQKDWNAVKNN